MELTNLSKKRREQYLLGMKYGVGNPLPKDLKLCSEIPLPVSHKLNVDWQIGMMNYLRVHHANLPPYTTEEIKKLRIELNNWVEDRPVEHDDLA
jgi:hypothetical protein